MHRCYEIRIFTPDTEIGFIAGLLSIFGSAFLFGAENNLLKTNPGFEAGEEGWTFANDSMGEICGRRSDKRAARDLRIIDESPQAGSSVMSERSSEVHTRRWPTCFLSGRAPSRTEAWACTFDTMRGRPQAHLQRSY